MRTERAWPVVVDELDHLVPIVIVKPCDRAFAALQNHGSTRYMSLSEFQNEKGYCVWCEKKLEGRKLRWCSDACAEFAQFLCHPQDPASKMYRLIFVQKFACAGCGTSYEEEIRAMIRQKYRSVNGEGAVFYDEKLMRHRSRRPDDPLKPITLRYLGYGTGDRWHTDHIVPIHKGGKGIDPQNLQVLCISCHLTKTGREMSK